VSLVSLLMLAGALWLFTWERKAEGGTLVTARTTAINVIVLVKLFHTAPIQVESWIRIIAVAAAVFAAVEIEKWIRFGGRRGEQAIPE